VKFRFVPNRILGEKDHWIVDRTLSQEAPFHYREKRRYADEQGVGIDDGRADSYRDFLPNVAGSCSTHAFSSTVSSSHGQVFSPTLTTRSSPVWTSHRNLTTDIDMYFAPSSTVGE